jgi:hypothetical protein
MMAHAQKPYFVFRRNGRVRLNRRGCQFSRLLAAEVCASAVVMLDTPCSEVVWRILATHSIRQFPLHFPSRASQCAITFQLDSTHFYCLKYPPHRKELRAVCHKDTLSNEPFWGNPYHYIWDPRKVSLISEVHHVVNSWIRRRVVRKLTTFPRNVFLLSDYALKRAAVYSSDMLANLYKTTRPHIPGTISFTFCIR